MSEVRAWRRTQLYDGVVQSSDDLRCLPQTTPVSHSNTESAFCRTVRQPTVEEVSSGEGDAYCTEFCRRAAHLLYHRVLEKTKGLVDKIHISCRGAGTRWFVAHRAYWRIQTKHCTRREILTFQVWEKTFSKLHFYIVSLNQPIFASDISLCGGPIAFSMDQGSE